MASKTNRQMRRREGKAALAMTVLLLLASAGGYNYHRNWTAEQAAQGPRPYKTYSETDLTALRDAYRDEVDEFKRRYSTQQHGRQRADGSAAYVGERIAEFERIQRSSSALRATSQEVATREARLAEVQKELDYRAVLAGGLSLHIKRLTTL